MSALTPSGGPPPSGSSGRAGVARSPRRELVLALVTLAVIVGASADFLRAQTLKLEPSPLDRSRIEERFSPACGCEAKSTATLAFTVRRDLRLDAQMIDADGETVRSLARGQRLAPGRRRLEWDGRDDRGAVAPDGPYRLRLVLLDDERREIVVPAPVILDTATPRAVLLSVVPDEVVVGPRGRPRRNEVDLRYIASEPSRPTLLVDGRAAAGRDPGPGGRSVFRWGGRARGRALRPGTYGVSLRLRDQAGNVGAPSRRIEVRVRRAGERRSGPRGEAGRSG